MVNDRAPSAPALQAPPEFEAAIAEWLAEGRRHAAPVRVFCGRGLAVQCAGEPTQSRRAVGLLQLVRLLLLWRRRNRVVALIDERTGRELRCGEGEAA